MKRRFIGAMWLVGLLAMIAGSGTALGADTAKGKDRVLITTLRGYLSVPATNAVAPDVVAVLNSRAMGRKPCLLKATNAEMTGKLRELAAQGASLVVIGQPGMDAFTVISIHEVDRRTPGSNDTEAAQSILPAFHWGGVPETNAR